MGQTAQSGPAQAGAVIDRGYLPHARALAESLAAHHDGRRLTVLIVDADGTEGDEPFEILVPEDVGIVPRELHRRALLYDAQGLVSSLRPWLVAHLLERGGSVLLLDVDMEVFAPLDDLWALADRAGVVLSPHTTEPLAGRPGAWLEEALLRDGTFNGGLLGVGPAGRDFVAWMIARTARDCVRDPDRRLLYSQTWLNLVPALFEHAVIRDRGVNTMVHTLLGRDLEWRDGGPVVDGDAVRLFHYVGFDPAVPQQLCRHQPGESAAAADRPGIARLAVGYADRLRGHGWPAAPSTRWAQLPDGTAVDAVIRSLYRDVLLSAEAGGGPEPPDPFDPESDFVDWLLAPGHDGIPRYMGRLHALRPDLRAAFPAVPGDDRHAFMAWGAESDEVPATLSPRVSSVPGRPPAR